MTNPLREYLTSRGETAAAFAAKLEVSPSYLSRIISGEREADASLIAAISRSTDGEVRPDQWIAWWASKPACCAPAYAGETEGAA